MINHSIDKNQRKEFFDQLSKKMQNQQVEIEVAGLEIGDQIEEAWCQLQGVFYDPKKDMLTINAPDFEHSILKPQDVISLEEGNAIKAVVIKDANGEIQSLNFKAPLMIEAPERYQSH
jgi:hypothetical protein